MGLVDYSESSDSEAEAPTKPAPKPSQSNSKKPFQKVVDRSNPGKIRVNLVEATTEANSGSSDEPPAKRAKTGGGGGLFGGFNSFLPPPKNTNKPAPNKPSNAPRPGIHLKTSAEPGFSRNNGDGEDLFSGDGDLGFSASKAPAIPAEQKPAEEVRLVGKPLMFKPLSVARNAGKKKGTKPAAAKAQAPPATATTAPLPDSEATTSGTESPAAPKKVSIFGIAADEADDPTPAPGTGAYEPLFTAEDDPALALPHAADQPLPQVPAPSGHSSTLDTIADDLNLSAAARRELFGRNRSAVDLSAAKVVNFNTDVEYARNEELRATGEQQTHNPVRAIQPGKHSLRQLVNAVQNQREALEESFAKGKSNKREAAGRYGWGGG